MNKLPDNFYQLDGLTQLQVCGCIQCTAELDKIEAQWAYALEQQLKAEQNDNTNHQA